MLSGKRLTAFEIIASLLTLSAAFAYANHRWLRKPTSIALMAMALVLSLTLLGIDRLGLLRLGPLAGVLASIKFNDTLLHGMLGALLFAGAMHIQFDDLHEHKLPVTILAVFGTVLSTIIVAGLVFLLLRPLGLGVPWQACLLFGAVISPTDPIAVLGILKEARVPRSMEIQISGESLFNDGIGVVIFSTVLAMVSRGHVDAGDVALVFARETLGGALFGLVTGYVTFLLLRSIDHYQTELLLTLGLVFGGYAVAERLHLSAPISAVVAGLVIGNQGRADGMSDVTRDHLDKFWALIDEILNAVLFVLVGFEVIRISLSQDTLLTGALAIPAVLAARYVSVSLPILALGRARFPIGTIRVLTWGGLRGGISVALALSTPPGPQRDLIVTMTYVVVAFSILVQGLTLDRVARAFGRRNSQPEG